MAESSVDKKYLSPKYHVVRCQLDSILLDVLIDIQNELLKELGQHKNIDDKQVDGINEAVTMAVSLNREKYLTQLLKLITHTSLTPDEFLAGYPEETIFQKSDVIKLLDKYVINLMNQ